MIKIIIEAESTDELMVTLEDLRHRFGDDAAGVPAPRNPNPRLPSGAVGAWDERRLRLLARNVKTRERLEQFWDALAEELPDATVEPFPTSATIKLSDGRQAGLRLRAGWLQLQARRGNERLKRVIRTEEDIPAAIEWLRNELPDYADKGFGDPRRQRK